MVSRLLALGLVMLALGASSAFANPGGEDPTRLWSEYPLDPGAPGAAPPKLAPSADKPRRTEHRPTARAAIVASDEPSGSSPWTLPIAIVSGLALVGMGWLAMLVLTKDLRWKTTPAPRRRRSPAPVVIDGATRARTGTRATAATRGIRYRDH